MNENFLRKMRIIVFKENKTIELKEKSKELVNYAIALINVAYKK